MKKEKHASISTLRPDVVGELVSRNADHHRPRVKASCGRSEEIKVGKRETKIYELDRIDGGTASKPE